MTYMYLAIALLTVDIEGLAIDFAGVTTLFFERTRVLPRGVFTYTCPFIVTLFPLGVVAGVVVFFGLVTK